MTDAAPEPKFLPGKGSVMVGGNARHTPDQTVLRVGG